MRSRRTVRTSPRSGTASSAPGAKPVLTLSAAEILRPRRNWQAIVTVAILLIVGFLVVLPMVFLIEESLNIGDPMAFPPEAYGLKNYIAIFNEDINVLWN